MQSRIPEQLGLELLYELCFAGWCQACEGLQAVGCVGVDGGVAALLGQQFGQLCKEVFRQLLHRPELGTDGLRSRLARRLLLLLLLLWRLQEHTV